MSLQKSLQKYIVWENQGGNGDFGKIREYQGMPVNLIIRHGKYWNISEGKILVNVNFFVSFHFFNYSCYWLLIKFFAELLETLTKKCPRKSILMLVGF